MQWKKRPGSFGVYDQSLPADPGTPGVLIAAVSQAHPTAEANARLIESAPQLLKAAETLAWSMRNHIKDHPTQEWAALVDAICDATGFDPSEPQDEDEPTWTTAPGHPDLAAETARAATARRNEECQSNNAPPSA